MDADTGFVRPVVSLVQESHIVAGNHRQGERSSDVQNYRLVQRFLVAAGALQLDVKTIRKQLCPLIRQLLSPVGVPGEDRLFDGIRNAARLLGQG